MYGYGTVVAFADELGEDEHASLLNETLREEKETDEKLSKLAKQINSKVNERSDHTEVGGRAMNKKRAEQAA
ncbi:MAG: hypothetical protein JWO91_2135 [Acidobacteriaceae bacterium]|nr:hypothetical protein [Acidobacteriaceae bacterium]